MPYVGRFLVGLVEHEIGLRARIRIEEHLFVCVVELVERHRPSTLAEAPVRIHLAKRRNVAVRRRTHTAEQGVPHKNGKPATIAHHRLVLGRRRRGIERGARVFPLVDQARVDRAHDKPQPSDDVLEPLVALALGNRAVEGTKRLGQIPEKGTLVARDPQLLDIPLEVRGALQHVAQHRLRAQAEVARPRHALAVFLEGGIEQIFKGLFVGHVRDALEALLVFHAVHLHLGHGAVARTALLGAQHLARILKRRLDHRHHVERIVIIFRVQKFQSREQEG